MLFHSTKIDFPLGKFGHVMLVYLWPTRCVVVIKLRSLSLAFSIIRTCKTHFLWLSSLCKSINVNGVTVIYTCWISVLRDDSWIFDGKCPSHIWKKLLWQWMYILKYFLPPHFNKMLNRVWDYNGVTGLKYVFFSSFSYHCLHEGVCLPMHSASFILVLFWKV